MPLVSVDSEVLKSFTDDDLRICKSNKIWIQQSCSLEANYRSQTRPKVWVLDTTKWILGCPDTTTHRGCTTVGRRYFTQNVSSRRLGSCPLPHRTKPWRRHCDVPFQAENVFVPQTLSTIDCSYSTSWTDFADSQTIFRLLTLNVFIRSLFRQYRQPNIKHTIHKEIKWRQTRQN